MRSLTVALCASTVAGCAALLGGLDEGRPRPSEANETHPDASLAEAGRTCGSAWLEGYGQRAAFEVTSTYTQVVRDYTLPLSLDTRLLIQRGAMRSDVADLRVTADDGVTPLRFLSPLPAESEAAKLWTRLDLLPGKSRVYVYFGGPTDGPGARVDAGVFVDGVIPPFDPANGAWHASNPADTLSDGGANLSLHFDAAHNHVDETWCATVAFPEGHYWQIVLDLKPVERAAAGGYFVSVNGVPVFGSSDSIPLHDAVSNVAIEPSGSRELCFGVSTHPDESIGNVVSGSFYAPRLRVYALQPDVMPTGIEKPSCAK